VVGNGAFMGVLPSIASAARAKNDVAIPNFALALAYLQGVSKAAEVGKGSSAGRLARSPASIRRA
jgi:hypothetical protein